jgi:hypothetical protein
MMNRISSQIEEGLGVDLRSDYILALKVLLQNCAIEQISYRCTN